MAHLAIVDPTDVPQQRTMMRSAIEEKRLREKKELEAAEEKAKEELKAMPADAAEVLDAYMNDIWNKTGDANAAYCLALQRRRREEQVEPDNDMAEHYLDLAAQKRMTPSAYVAMRRWSEQATARGQQWPYGCSPEIEPDTRETMPRTSFPYVPQEFYDDAKAKVLAAEAEKADTKVAFGDEGEGDLLPQDRSSDNGL